MQWVIRQRSPAGDWFVRATLDTREEAEECIAVYRRTNPHLEFLLEEDDDL